MGDVSIFISHSSKDKEVVRRLAADLRREGLKVWFDEADLLVGERFSEQAIRASQYLVLVQSNAARESAWVRREIELANEAGLPILPVVLEDLEQPWAGLADRGIADFRRGYRRGLWRLISRITGRPDPLIGAKTAAQRVKAQMMASGELFGLSQQGVGTFYSLRNRGDWDFADTSEGLSRLWIVEVFDREQQSVHPFAIMDNEIHELPVLYLLDSDPQPVADAAIVMSSTIDFPRAEITEQLTLRESGDQPVPIAKRYTRYRPAPFTRPFVDSDVAVKSALEGPETQRRLGAQVGKLFTLTKLESDKLHGNSLLWKVSFFDPSLSESVMTVGVDGATGRIKYPAMRAESLNANFMPMQLKDGQIVLSARNQVRAMEGHAWEIGKQGDSFVPRQTAADALRLAGAALGDERSDWQFAFLSNTGVVRSVTSKYRTGADGLMRVDGTAGQWVVEMCGLKGTPITEGDKSGYEYDYRQILVTREEGAVLVHSGKCVFTVPLSLCPLPPQLSKAYQWALALALRTVSVDFEVLSVAHTRHRGGLRWCFRFYDSEDIVQKIWVAGDGSRVVE
jgi:hypothetical protein